MTDFSVTIGVATYGSDEWRSLAQQRAIPSALAQNVNVIHRHGETLAGARNMVLVDTETEYLVNLDADDELEPGYVEALAAGTADLRAPAVRYVRGVGEREPYVPRVAGHAHDCTAECISSGAGNWLVIGTWARTQLLREAGGWRDWPMYEDFDLWMRAIRLGATVEAIPAAVYRAYVNRDSRNRAPSMGEKNRVHQEIVRSILGDQVAA